MTLNSTGQISIGGSTSGQSINLELGRSATAQSSLNDSDLRSLAGVASGQISLSNFYSKTFGYKLWAWGYNIAGALGDGTITNKSSPIQIGALTDWYILDAGANTAAIKTNGTLWTWGYNQYGNLGRGPLVDTSSPVQLGSLTNWASVNISKRYFYMGAIKTDGTLWMWGNNSQYGLGDGTATTRSSPVQIGSLTNWSKLSCGEYHTMAIKTDGTLWAWGANVHGQCGTNTSGNYYSSPVQVGSDTNWIDISAGIGFTIGLKSNGTLWSWGTNDYGQLGYNTSYTYSCFNCTSSSGPPYYNCFSGYYTTCTAIAYKSSPVQIGSLTTWSKISAGAIHVGAIKTDGTLWTWGADEYLALGHSNTYVTNRSSPTQVGSLTTWSKLEFGEYSSTAIKTDGTLWAWGTNGNGTVGNNVGFQSFVSSPVQIGSATNWYHVASGYYNTMGLKR